MGKGSKLQKERLFVRHSGWNHPVHRLESFVQRHPFNCSLQILIPKIFSHSRCAALQKAFKWRSNFAICRFEMEIFASPSFLDRWILNKDLDFEAVSIDGWSDGTDAVCITHKLLRISLTPESYQMLGLTGRKSTQAKGKTKTLPNRTVCNSRSLCHRHQTGWTTFSSWTSIFRKGPFHQKKTVFKCC